MYKDLPFDSQKDFAPIVLIGKSPVIIVARPDLPAKSLKELIGYAKANPDKLTAGYPGNGTLGHVTGELLQQRAQIRFSHTQYRGSAAIMTDLLGGHIDIGMDSMAAYVPNVKEGKLKALAIGAATRWPGLPEVPTAAESGLAGFEASVWYALLAPAKTPADIIAKSMPRLMPSSGAHRQRRCSMDWESLLPVEVLTISRPSSQSRWRNGLPS